METTRRTLRVFTACGPENGCIRVSRLVAHITTLHSWPAEDVSRLAACGHSDEWLDFLHFWAAMDAFWERREGKRKDDPSAALVREMRAFRDHLLASEQSGQVVVAELLQILRAQRHLSEDPSYWDEVQSQLPSGGMLDLSELAEALYVWLCEFEDEWNADVGSCSKPGRTPSKVRLTPRSAPPTRTPLRDVTNMKEAWHKAPHAYASTSTGGDSRPTRTVSASRPSLADELRDAERSDEPTPPLEAPTPRWCGGPGPTPRPVEATPWRRAVERDVASLRDELEQKASALTGLQEHCAALCSMLASLPVPAELTPRARHTWRTMQSSARGEAGPEECVEELARELKTLEVQKVSSDEEIGRLLRTVSAQEHELAELRRLSLEKADSVASRGVSIGAKAREEGREKKEKKEKDRRRKEKERRRREEEPSYAEACRLM